MNRKMSRTVIYVSNFNVKYVLSIYWMYISIYRRVVCNQNLDHEAILGGWQNSILHDDFTTDMFILSLVKHWNVTIVTLIYIFLFYTICISGSWGHKTNQGSDLKKVKEWWQIGDVGDIGFFTSRKQQVGRFENRVIIGA